MKKKSHKQKLIKELDKLASEFVRKRDGKCMLCGATNTLQAHHYIVTKGRSTKYRWDTRNLITLCYACHLYKVHSTASIQFIDMLKKSAIMNHIATEQEIDTIKNDFTLANFSTGDLEEIKKQLQEKLNDK